MLLYLVKYILMLLSVFFATYMVYLIIYQAEKEPGEQIVYSDLNWAGDHNDCKSITSFVSCLASNLII